MKYRIELTRDWPAEKFEPYGPAVTAAMKKLADRFPEDVSVKGLADEILSGTRDLWLILDGEDQFVSFVATSIHVVNHTGMKVCTITSLGGDAGLDCVDDCIPTIEEWAWSQGVDMCGVEGREGWRKPLARNGYRPYAVIYRKPRPADWTGAQT